MTMETTGNPCCPLTFGAVETRLTRESFARACMARRRPKSRFGGMMLDKTPEPACTGCATGLAVEEGRADFPPPPGVEFIGLAALESGQRQTKGETMTMTVSDEIKKLCLAADGAKVIDYERDGFADGLDSLTAKDLRPYWTAPVPMSKRKGRCVNCGDELSIKACGLCTLCYTDASGKRGAELLEDLANARRTARERRKAAPRKAIEARRKAIEARRKASVAGGKAAPRRERKQAAGPVAAGDPLAMQVGGSHYKHYAIQPIEFFIANGVPYAEAAVMKYVLRHRRKNGAEDLKKAMHILEILLKEEYGESY